MKTVTILASNDRVYEDYNSGFDAFTKTTRQIRQEVIDWFNADGRSGVSSQRIKALLGDKGSFIKCIFTFENDNDAMLFKLTFGGM